MKRKTTHPFSLHAVTAFALSAVCLTLAGVWTILQLPPYATYPATPPIITPVERPTPEDAVRDPDKGVASSTLTDIAATPPAPTPVTSTKPILPPSSKRPQFVTLAFDGSYSLEMWKKTRAFAAEMDAKGAPVDFTYFISGVYLLPFGARQEYIPPRHATGTSAIGYAINDADVSNRIEQMNLAISEGHEIASHANGHFDGSNWSLEEWKQELDAFNHLIARAERKGIERGESTPRSHLDLPVGQAMGFRAPELGRNNAMYDALAGLGYRYDTSGVGKSTVWPVKDAHGLWLFPLAQIRYATTSSILSMDYNFYFKQTAAKDTLKRGTPEWQRAYDEVLMSFTTYFNTNYNGNRAPVTMGNHFSEWNEGLYWEVMKDFARNVCGLPDVQCVTFTHLADWLDAHTTTQ